ncbi:ATP-binding protein [Candidatus Woesearchaeota archaeon]|nr:ATP-binding protein [Candidatus Woesearchaeota archaeon]
MIVDTSEQIEKFKEFIEINYSGLLKDIIKKGRKAFIVDFNDLSKFDPDLAEQLLSEPEDTLKAGELSISQFDLPDMSKLRIRARNLPSSERISIKNIRSEHLGKLITLDGIVRQASDVRPQVVSAKFECPSCGNNISILQIDTRFKEPVRCSCGRRGKFRLVSKDLVDAQRLVLEESPEGLEGGEQPKRISVFLKEDLVEPVMEKKTTPGSLVRVVGIIKEVPVFLKTGAQSIRFDLMIEANFIEPVEETFEDVEISKEDEEKILNLAKDPGVYEKLAGSIAPSIFGHEPIKEALVLQLMGGVRKVREDGTKVKGDIHVLLVGDPGAAKCVTGESKVVLADGSIERISEIVNNCDDKIHRIDDGTYKVTNHDLPTVGLDGKVSRGKATILWKRKSPKGLYKVTTKTGREIIVTPTHPFFVCNKSYIIAKPARKIKNKEFIAAPRFLDIKGKRQEFKLDIKRTNAKNGNHIKIPKYSSVELNRVLGYLLAEGYLRKNKTTTEIKFDNFDNPVLEDYNKCFKKVFEIPLFRLNPRKSKNCFTLRATSVELGRFFDYIAPSYFKRSRYKEIPSFISKCIISEIRSFLQAYFDTEASIHKTKGIYVVSASKSLIEDLQTLLLRFGIISQIHPTFSRATNSRNKTKRKYFRLVISGEDVKRFRERVGFTLARKKNILNHYLKDRKFNTNKDVIPNLSAVLSGIRKKHNLSQFDMGIPRSTYQHLERGDRNPSRYLLKKIIGNISNFSDSSILRLKQLANSDIFWDQVKEIKKINSDEDWVYDLQVNDTHNFLANNLVVHNSTFLTYIAYSAPKARYVAGRGSSGAGLTASVVKDEFLRGWALEAGALVLANKGFCCIDEMDKMKEEDTSALHEGMAQQTITISKANIQASLKAETTVLAAANPKLGRFDPYKSVAEQINMPPALINRFDLIFPVRDLPNKEKDAKIAGHILKLSVDSKESRPIIDRNLLKLEKEELDQYQSAPDN